MRILLGFIGGGIIGYLGSFLIKFGMESDLSSYSTVILSGIMVLVAIIHLVNIWFILRIRKLDKLSLDGIEEDEADFRKYKYFSDSMLCNNVSMILSVLAISFVFILELSKLYIVLSASLLMISFVLMRVSYRAGELVYKDRELPTINEARFSEKLIDAADDGEKHIMLQGMYKSFNLTHIALFFGLIATTAYSLITGTSQVFSMIIIAIIYILMNGRYLLAIRNKG